jgi:hypothetical protein
MGNVNSVFNFNSQFISLPLFSYAFTSSPGICGERGDSGRSEEQAAIAESMICVFISVSQRATVE